MSQASLGRPEFVPGTPPGHPTAKFLYVIFLYRLFLSLIASRRGVENRGSLISVLLALRARGPQD